VISLGLNTSLMHKMSRLPQTQPALSEAQPAYKLYIVIPADVTDTDSYIRRLEGILANRVTGFTMYPTRGGGSSADGQMKYQTTLVCELYGTDEQTVLQVAREAMAEFGLEDVPIATSLAGWQVLR